jgi:predicted pyridoxine 5'-phosphate oxidase superfamily flavin-nucleotide-binding protein
MLIDDREPSPWHAGEIALQRHVGVSKRLAEIGRLTIRDHLIAQHRDFYSDLPMVVMGVVDPAGDAWATLRFGMPGFLWAPDPYRLHLALRRDPLDPADGGLEDERAIGLLGIDLQTRRRNRLNGTLARADAGFDVGVLQSFGNCPKYIQEREAYFVRDPAIAADSAPVSGPDLDDHARRIIATADTFFVASYVDLDDGQRQVDISHRGGPTGFVHIGEDGALTIPDYAGNLYFNTLGNILLNPKVGLAFADFETGDLLQLTGNAEVLLNSPEINAFPKAQRLWRFTPHRIVRRVDALPLRWRFRSWSPSLASTERTGNDVLLGHGAK